MTEDEQMGMAEELQQLDELFRNGALTHEEFTLAKSRLIATPPVTTPDQLNSILADQLAAVHFQNELARIDREWEIERLQYQISQNYVPTIGNGLATILVGVTLGALWIGLAFTLFSGFTKVSRYINSLPNSDSIVMIVGNVMPLIGVFFTVMMVTKGIYRCVVAQNYKTAYAAYQVRRLRTLE